MSIAVIFPGQGAQNVGMGKALADAFPVCRETFEQADAALGTSLSRIIFDGPEEELMLTANTQPAILTVSIAAYRLLESKGLTPSFVAGHSFGEFSANVAGLTTSPCAASRHASATFSASRPRIADIAPMPTGTASCM